MSEMKFFWLHIKKAGGSTTRKLLQPYYNEVDRTVQPANFIQASPDEYNDILNNFRVVLGEYQFKRCLFAKKYLYPDNWDDLLSFAFCRHPVDRCVSMFYYLYWPVKGISRFMKNIIKQSRRTGRLHYSTSYAFDVFLENVQKAHTEDNIFFLPYGLHFTTHTAPMWGDITDTDGNILIKRIFRLDNMYEGINKIFEECGLEKRLDKKNDKKRLNNNSQKGNFKPSKTQITKIKEIYPMDFELYEDAINI